MNNLGPVKHPVHETREFHYGTLEKLPPELRALLYHAPYKYAVGPWYARYLRFAAVASVQEIARDWARRMAGDRRNSVLELYGPDHPQARP